MRTRLFAVASIAVLIHIASADIPQKNAILPFTHAIQDRRSDHDAAQSGHAKSLAHTAATPAIAQPIPTPTVCGNGIIEHGEECDCGSPTECAKDPCCNAKTCKLVPGAQCSNQQECCSRCQFQPVSFVCRPATAECSMAGMCTGIGAKCPATNKNSCLKHSASATPSNTTESKAGGSCESSLYSARDLQCQALSSGGFNFTTACAKDTLSCQISCTDPKGGSRDSARCMQFTTHFSDGTECGQDGVCTNGTCIEIEAPSFFKKNILAFAIGGTSIAFALLFCFASICFLRRRRRIREETAKKREDAYPMSESINRRSNIRIGLDPSENGLVATLPAYEPKSAFTRRSSAGIQGTLARSANAYSPDALLTEQEMVQDLAVNSYPELNPSTSSWPTAPIPVTPAYRNPSPGNTLWKDTKSGSTLQKSISVNNHVVYVPPPLPSVTLTSSPKTNNMPSPYADEAMNVFSSDSPPLSPLLPVRSKAANINIIVEKFRKETVQIDEASDSGISTASYNDEYESSILRLDSTLTMDRYNENIANNRTSVSSFFSTLAIDSEPVPVNRPPTPPLPEASFASEEYIMPAPVARVTTISTSRAPKAPSPSSSLASSKLSPSLSNKKKSAYERKQEEIKVAECFAQDLGFDIVNPSPMASPRHGISRTTADQQRIV